MGLSTLRKFYAIARAGGYYCGPAIGHPGGHWVEDRLNAYVLRFPTYGRALARIHHEGFALTTVGVPAVVEEVDVKQAVLFEGRASPSNARTGGVGSGSVHDRQR